MFFVVNYSLRLQPLAEAGRTNGTVEILMESSPDMKINSPIYLDINQIEIISVTVAQLDSGDNHLPMNLETDHLVINHGKLLSVTLANLRPAKTIQLSVVVHFVSKITDTLQGIYKVDYNDDLGVKNE